jgi:hypothetical protein
MCIHLENIQNTNNSTKIIEKPLKIAPISAKVFTVGVSINC